MKANILVLAIAFLGAVGCSSTQVARNTERTPTAVLDPAAIITGTFNGFDETKSHPCVVTLTRSENLFTAKITSGSANALAATSNILNFDTEFIDNTKTTPYGLKEVGGATDGQAVWLGYYPTQPQQYNAQTLILVYIDVGTSAQEKCYLNGAPYSQD